ncbi:MAG: nuclear transport factor 2 family protein [Deltaproteobacteria bacterium]|nr:nuclear transport factor 2 family protein [Deltaproteobacteria bacterium]
MGAGKPEDVGRLFAEAFAAGDPERLLALYEPGASLVMQGGQIVTGTEGLREALNGFLALCGEFRLEVKSAVEAEGVALVRAEWSLTGGAPGGCAVNLKGRSIEVLRRQADGTWLYAIDAPFGG